MDNKSVKFNKIYNELFEKIMKFAFYKVGIYQDAEDIAGEVFTAVWKNIENIDDTSNVKGLVYQIAQNKINDFLRLQYKNKDLVVNADQEYIENVIQPADDNVFRTEFWKVINNLKLMLNERELYFYSLRYEKNQQLKYVAEEMQITLNNAKVINNRLVNKIKKIWQEMNKK